VLRFWSGQAVHYWMGHGFPWGTLTVNVTGSLLMGLGYVWLHEVGQLDPAWRLALLTGLAGSFTTFSTFSLESLRLLETGQVGAAAASVAANVVLCLGAAGIGLWLGRAFT
jgi:CrcB protein